MHNIPHGTVKFAGLNVLDEAYVTTCGALMELDKKKKESKDEQ